MVHCNTIAKQTYSCRILAFGLGGHSEHYARQGCSTSTLSGYDSPERWEPRPNTEYDDAIVIDKRQAVESDAGYQWVFRGPMVSVDLEPGQVDRLGNVSPIMAGAMAENAYGQLLALHESQRGQAPGPLDYVSPHDYAIGWQAHGARIGRVVDGRIVWNE